MHNKPHTDIAKAKISTSKKGVPALWKRRATKSADGVTLYRCGKCKEFFDASCFYKDSRTLLGLKTECKKCHTATTIASRDLENSRRLNSEYMRRARAKNPDKFRERDRISSKINRIKHAGKVSAREKLNSAVRSGDVKKPNTCENCGNQTLLSGHHADYNKPLDVKWLCYSCHGKEHRAISFRRVDLAAVKESLTTQIGGAL